MDVPGRILMAVYFLCSLSLDDLRDGRESCSSPLDEGADTLVSFWFGGVNRGVTDPTKTSILPLITCVVGEAAVQNLRLSPKLHKTNCRTTCRFRGQRSWNMRKEVHECSVWVLTVKFIMMWTILSSVDISWPLDYWQAIKAPPIPISN